METLLVSEERMVVNPVMNIGVEGVQGPVDETEELTSNYDEFVDQIHRIIGEEQAHRSDLQFAPAWIVDKTISEDLTNN